MTLDTRLRPEELREPPWARFLFASTPASVLWLIVRLYLAYEWLQAGTEKLTSPAWTGAHAGTALAGFIHGALGKTGGPTPQVQGWYATFLSDTVLPHVSIWAHLVAYGETLVGLALLLGALTGLAAFAGIFMNANYLLAGTVSTNPILALLGVLIVLAWRNAGWIGLDRWLLPLLGTPWQPGAAFRRDRVPAAEEDADYPA